MHGDSHDRYERLTSVSSSVDFDQRDNVSALPQTCSPPAPPPGCKAQKPWPPVVQGQGPMECDLLLSKGNACLRAAGNPPRLGTPGSVLHGDPQASTSLASHIPNFVPHRTLCLSPHPLINPKDPFSLRVLEVTVAFLVH